jgi:hypothetical protein
MDSSRKYDVDDDSDDVGDDDDDSNNFNTNIIYISMNSHQSIKLALDQDYHQFAHERNSQDRFVCGVYYRPCYSY